MTGNDRALTKDEGTSPVRARTHALDARTLEIAGSIAPDVDRVLTAYDARVATCDHLAFDEITSQIAYRCGEQLLFGGVVEELARLGASGVLTFAWRAHPDAPPPSPRVETARSMLRGLGLHALLLGEIALDGATPNDIAMVLRLGLHFYEADGMFHEERGGFTIYYAVFEGAAPERPGRSGKLGETLAHFRVARTTSRPIPREDDDSRVPRVESVRPGFAVAGPASADPPPVTERAPSLVSVLPVAQRVFSELATVVASVRKAVLLVNVRRGVPRIVMVDAFATDGDGELCELTPSPELLQAVEAMLDREEHAGNGEFSRLLVEMASDASIKLYVR